MEASADVDLKALCERVLEDSLVQLVGSHFNDFYLVFADACYSVTPVVGGEILQIFPMTSRPKPGTIDKTTSVISFPLFERFKGRRICAARKIGSAWNGHGFEFSFENLYNHTMIIQSIYTGVKPDLQADCLRIGVGKYDLHWPPDGGAE